MGKIDKGALVGELKARFGAELDRCTRQARDAADAVTHEDNRPEGDKDMRSTEASYIARGQAERAGELEATIKKLAAMPILAFAEGDRIQASALVDVADTKDASRKATYFLVPAGGGERLGDVQTLAIASPLGKALLGLSEGDEAEVGPKTWEVLRVR